MSSWSKEGSLARLHLSCALTANDRTRALLDGAVKPDAIDLDITRLDPGEMFFRQLKNAEFDVSEMSLATLMIATSQGPTPWVALPVFTMRRFFHANLMVSVNAGISAIGDLKGKRLGIPEFQQTAAVWVRGIFRDEFGFDSRDAEWLMERSLELSHGAATGFKPPRGYRLRHVSQETDLSAMIVKGDVDALLHWAPSKNVVDRTTVDPMASPNVKRFFDPVAESRRYYGKTGMFPINHCVVVRRSIAEAHPWVVLNLYSWFLAGKARDMERRDALLDPYFTAGVLDRSLKAPIATDVMPYGVQGARPVLETISRYLSEDELTSRRVGLEEIFHPGTLDL
jgi:4,5-dihydroxyphthalate decarboxylase